MSDHYPFRSWCRYCVMAASRSDHHRRQAEDYTEVPVISCDYGFFTDSRDHDERQLTEAEAIAVRATPILVIRDKRSKMIHADCVRCKGIEDEFPIETTAKWILGLGCPEVIIRTDGESSIVALSRRVGEKLREAGVETIAQHKPSMRQQISRTRREWHQNCERENSHVDIAVVGTPHGIVFSRSIRRVPQEDSGDGMLFNSIRGVPERDAPPPTVGEQLPRRVYIRRSVEMARYGYTDRCRVPTCEIGFEASGSHNEECRARIVRNMTADDNFNQRVQIAQDRTVEATPPEARTGERDPVPEPARKKIRFAERVEEQTPEGNSWYKFTECQQQFEQFKKQFQFVSQQQWNRDCTIDAG